MLEDAGTVFTFCKISAVAHGNSSSTKSWQGGIGFFLVTPTFSFSYQWDYLLAKHPSDGHPTSVLAQESENWPGADGAHVCHCQPGIWCLRGQSITQSSKHLEMGVHLNRPIIEPCCRQFSQAWDSCDFWGPCREEGDSIWRWFQPGILIRPRQIKSVLWERRVPI